MKLELNIPQKNHFKKLYEKRDFFASVSCELSEILQNNLEVPSIISKMEPFVKIVEGFQLLTIFVKSFISNV